jgi:hypothetical protein
MIAGLEQTATGRRCPSPYVKRWWSQNSGCQCPTYLAGSTHSIGHQRHRPAFDSAAGLR